uniref:P4a n=1 Tax=Poxviridae sp. TaxID=2717630 RepID=A0A6G8HJ41_9POXV|nr:P4a precursor [Poxviridae sp.]
MMSTNNIITLDQLEGAEYMYNVLSTVLPTLCLDYNVKTEYKHSYFHPFDVLFSPNLESLIDPIEYSLSVQQVGINYLLDSTSSQHLFNAKVKPGSVIKTQNQTYNLTDRTNPIINTHSYSDLPIFTRDLINTRVTSCEAHARIIGGYVPAKTSPSILSPIPMPNLSFSNTYLLNLLYSDVIGTDTGFRARIVNGIMMTKDVISLLEIRALLSPASRLLFDKDYNIDKIASDHNIVIVPNPVIDTDLSTMPFRYLVMFFQHFNTRYMLRKLTFNGDELLLDDSEILDYVASLHYQQHIQDLKQYVPAIPSSNTFEIRVRSRTTNQLYTYNITVPGVEFISISSSPVYYLTLLSMIHRSKKIGVAKLISTNESLFWDGISYDDYKNMPLTEHVFLGSTCYMFGLYNYNGITYCSRLNDIISSGKIPFRVCMLVRTISNKTVPQLISDILHSMNSTSPKDFPRKSTFSTQHIGLSEPQFMKFFQFLRLMGKKTPEVALKEVMMAYAGLKLEDSGSPHLIRKENFKEFITLLLTAMGFKITFRRGIISSHHHVSASISPRISKQYISQTLSKANCTNDEISKLMSSANDLLQFLVSIGDVKDVYSYNLNKLTKAFRPSPFYSTHPMFNMYIGGSNNSMDVDNISAECFNTDVHIVENIPIIDRINIRGIMAASTIDEMISTDLFMPETVAFKQNLNRLINEIMLSSETILQTMPISLIDRYIQVGGGSKNVSLGEIIDGVTEGDDSDVYATNSIINVIHTVLRDNYLQNTGAMASQALSSVTASANKQLDNLKQAACGISVMFKQLAKSIYIMEKIFKVTISDDVKEGILEKYKVYTEISKDLYLDLIALETTRALMYILRQSGRSISDTEIGADDLKKAFEMIKPKIKRLIDYYSDISKTYFNHMKKNLNISKPDSITFDTE